jgi:hypothetical protein
MCRNFHWRGPDLINIKGFFDLFALLDRPKDELALDLLVSFGNHRAIDEKLFQLEQVNSDIFHHLTAAESDDKEPAKKTNSEPPTIGLMTGELQVFDVLERCPLLEGW